MVLATVGLIPLPETGFGSDTVNRPLKDVATVLAVDDWGLLGPDGGPEVPDTELVPLIVMAVEVVRTVVCPPGSTDARRPLLELDAGREVMKTELAPLIVVASVVVKVMICPPGRVDVSTTGFDEAGLEDGVDTGPMPSKLVEVSTIVVVWPPGRIEVSATGLVEAKLDVEDDTVLVTNKLVETSVTVVV